MVVDVALDSSETLRFDANLKWLFTELPFEERVAAAAEHGFAGVEITAPYEYSTATLRRWLSDAGLPLVLINTPGGEPGSPTAYGLACDPGAVQEFRAGFRLALEYASDLGGPLVHLMAGVVPGSVTRDRARGTYLENLAWAVETTGTADITLVVEVLNQRDVPGYVLGSMSDAVGAIDQVGGGAKLRLLFDVYHVQVNEGDLTTRWRELAPRVGHIQIADTPDRFEPDTGELRWDYLFDEIVSSGYGGWIGCEYRPRAGTVAGLGWRDRHAARPAR